MRAGAVTRMRGAGCRWQRGGKERRQPPQATRARAAIADGRPRLQTAPPGSAALLPPEAARGCSVARVARTE